MKDNGSSVLRQCESAGFKFAVVGDELRFKPSSMPEDLFDKVRDHREELLKIVKLRQALKGTGATLEAYRRFAPSLWELYRAPDGRCGLLYGVTPRGIMLDIGGVIFSFQPGEIQAMPPSSL